MKYPIKLSQQLVDHPVCDTGGVLTSSRSQRFKLVEENKTWASSLSSLKKLSNFRFACSNVPLWKKMHVRLQKICFKLNTYLERSSGPLTGM